MKSLLLSIVSIVLAASSCAQGTGVAAPSLLGAWRVVEIDGAAIPEDVPATVEFSAAGRVSGVGGCNRYGGTYAYDDGALSVGPLMATKMACAEEGLMRVEAMFHERFSGELAVVGAEDGTVLLTARNGRLLLKRLE